MRYLITTKYSNYASWFFCMTCGYVSHTGDEVLSVDGLQFTCIRCGADFNEYGNERFQQTTIAVKDLKNPLYPFPARTTLIDIWDFMTKAERKEFVQKFKESE